MSTVRSLGFTFGCSSHHLPALFFIAAAMLISGCDPGAAKPVTTPTAAQAAAERDAGPASTSMPIRGYNYTGEGVEEFLVNGSYVSNLPAYGGGGADSCCARLPFLWREGLTVKVDWTMGSWTTPYAERKHLSWKEQLECCARHRKLSQVVPVQRYEQADTLQVFFLPDDKLEVWVSKYDLGHPNHPSGRKYPIDPAEVKEPKP